jgi:hypothetical protein
MAKFLELVHVVVEPQRLMPRAALAAMICAVGLFAVLVRFRSRRWLRDPRRIRAPRAALHATGRRAWLCAAALRRPQDGADDYRCKAGLLHRRCACGRNGRIVRVLRTSLTSNPATSGRTASEQRPARAGGPFPRGRLRRDPFQVVAATSPRSLRGENHRRRYCPSSFQCRQRKVVEASQEPLDIPASVVIYPSGYVR